MKWIFYFIYISFIIEVVLFFRIKNKLYLILNIKKKILKLIIPNKISDNIYKFILSRFIRLFKIYFCLFLIFLIIIIPLILSDLIIKYTIDYTTIIISIIFFIIYLKIRNVIIK